MLREFNTDNGDHDGPEFCNLKGAKFPLSLKISS